MGQRALVPCNPRPDERTRARLPVSKRQESRGPSRDRRSVRCDADESFRTLTVVTRSSNRPHLETLAAHTHFALHWARTGVPYIDYSITQFMPWVEIPCRVSSLFSTLQFWRGTMGLRNCRSPGCTTLSSGPCVLDGMLRPVISTELAWMRVIAPTSNRRRGSSARLTGC